MSAVGRPAPRTTTAPVADAAKSVSATAAPSARAADSDSHTLPERIKSYVTEVMTNAGTHSVTRAYIRRRLDSFGGIAGAKSSDVAAMFEQVLDANRQHGSVVAYADRFRAMLEEPSTTAYLKHAVRTLRAGHNLWDATLTHTGGDRHRALELIGVLFQDLTLNHGHVQWAMPDAKTSRARINIMLMVDAIRLTRGQGVDRMFPAETDGQAPDRAYHFWAIAYAASEMQRRLPSADGSVAPFLFNVFYEYLTDKDLLPKATTFEGGIRVGKLRSWIEEVRKPRDPDAIDERAHEEDLKDLYLGYAGARFGAGKPVRPFDEFKLLFSANPRAFIRQEFFPDAPVQGPLRLPRHLNGGASDTDLNDRATATRLARRVSSLDDKQLVRLEPERDGAQSAIVPFDGDGIFEALKDDELLLVGKRAGRNIKAVEVEPPTSFGDLLHTMGRIADRAQAGMNNEYALFLYQDDSRRLRFFVQRGGWLSSTVKPSTFLVDADGRRLALVATLAHTHPRPSDASDHDRHHVAALGRFHSESKARYQQRFSAIVSAGGRQVLFDTKGSYKVPPSSLQKPWQEVLFQASRSATGAV